MGDGIFGGESNKPRKVNIEDSAGNENFIGVFGVFAYANDVFAVIAKDVNGNNVKCRIMLNWEEHF